jgi:hypothetical protein
MKSLLGSVDARGIVLFAVRGYQVGITSRILVTEWLDDWKGV